MGSLLDRPGGAPEGVDGVPAGSGTVEVLGDADRGALRRLVAQDPVANVVLDARLDAVQALSPRRFGGTVLGVRDDAGALRAAAFHGGNLLPVGGDATDWQLLADHLAAGPRQCTSIVGRRDQVSTMWRTLEPAWGSARAVRERQPLLLLDDASALPTGDLHVARVRIDDFDAYLPAAAAMFTEELDVSPFRATHGDEYRHRIAALIRDGRAFARFDDRGQVAFKADFGAVSRHTCQVQGVWVRPDLRGQGLGTRALATVLREGLQVAPSVSLYVNAYNEPARRMYAALGMREIGTLTTVLF